MGLDPGDDFWPDVCARLAPDQNSEMLQPNPNLAWILNDTHTRCWHHVDTSLDGGKRRNLVGHGYNRKRWH